MSRNVAQVMEAAAEWRCTPPAQFSTDKREMSWR